MPRPFTRPLASAALALLAVSSLAAPAWAQAEGPAECATPCAPNERCVNGQCVANPDAKPVAPPPPAEPPPPPARANPDAEEEAAPPARKPRPRRKPAVVADEEPTAEPPQLESWRRGLVVLPMVGLHLVEGIASSDFGAGLRLGILLGTHVARTVSLNVEIARNFLSPNPDPMTRGQPTAGDVTIAFDPLFHAATGPVEFVAGPKLGFWSLGGTVPNVDGTTDQVAESGWAFGFNVGFLVGTGDTVGVGAMLAYQIDLLTQSCARGPDLAAAGVEGCNNSGSAPHFLSVSLGALF
jgi:hypothetical protein